MTAATLERPRRPSAVLGEFMTDLDTLRAQGWEGVAPLRTTSPTARFAEKWLGPKVRERYLLDLYHLASKPQAQAKPKRPRTDALFNERRMRVALLAAVKATGWVSRGTRRLAEDAGMPYRTARDVLARMVRDGQVSIQPWARGRARGTNGIHLLLEHPAWSDPKTAHALARSKLSSQVEARNRASLSTGEQGRLRRPTSGFDSPREGGSSSPRNLEWEGQGQDDQAPTFLTYGSRVESEHGDARFHPPTSEFSKKPDWYVEEVEKAGRA